ncbi:MAG: hypothetical protein JJE21_02925 [Spirochaetaceae bacterium]|nr:hypothetical protein [Spirochaetaceae bacterium]
MHPKQDELERTLNKMCLDLDNYLEDKYGDLFPKHPNRLKRGQAANGNYDGLFSVNTNFSLGYGSNEGRGYVVDIDIVTLSWVSKNVEKKVSDDGVEYMRSLLPKYFPTRKIYLKVDNNLFKLVGDFSLGSN